MNVAKTLRQVESGTHTATRLGEGPTLERLRLENGGTLPLDLVLSIADVLLFHMDQGHKRGSEFRYLHASAVALLADGSLVVSPSPRGHARAPEPEITSNEQTDVFVIGALLFSLLTGEDPVVTLDGFLPSLAGRLPAIPFPVARAIQRALHPRRAVRWLDVAELRDALFGDEGERRTLPIGFQSPEWARELMDRAHARRAG